MSGFLEVIKFLFSLLYFSLVDFGFFAYNAFIERKRVSKPKNPILLLSASQLIEKLKAKELKSVDIIKAYVKRIDEVNDIINAAVFKNYAKALELAQKCDEQLELSEANSEDMDKIYTSKPLFGIPFTVKDSMEIEGLNITCGIPARKGIIAEETTPALKNIQNAGAILIAVTNVPELWDGVFKHDLWSHQQSLRLS
ncbi:hypothetical protein L596_027046 [Steinernema carpocapsae]|uniref:Amidase domain-containing protein n=1 Tax=Steinernema carpocapsae TaxID=34508 RepID=A0A4U5M360_STECR|nr:hypothetical protein L596_027046 [Steinernema carpocapsae]